MKPRVIVNLFVVLVFSLMANVAFAVTKVAPPQAEAGHPFTIIDTHGRLVDGAVAVFRLGGLEVVLSGRTHKPYNTMQGRLASDMYGGEYTVFVRPPDGTEFEIGPFTVLGPTAPPPSIAPDIGAPGDAFTITDPLARIQGNDLALFYAEGTNPADGEKADNVVVSPDGMTLSGDVPSGAAQDEQNFVSVRPARTADSRFGDLGFFVTVVAEPSISPTSGPVGTPFTITDPLGRMQPGDFCIFYEPGSDPEIGTQVSDAQVSADGTTLTGTVPGVQPVEYAVTVRASPAAPSRFGDLEFLVTRGPTEPSISPTSGPTGTAFTITDPIGRIDPASVVLFYKNGQDPALEGVDAANLNIIDLTTLTGQVPTGALGGENLIWVSSTRATAPYFTPLTFDVQ